mgnify:CR=1 FL=1
MSEKPLPSNVGGTYSIDITVEFQNLPEGTEVFYTLNGKTPDKHSKKYEEAIALEEEETVTLKYIAYNKKGIPSKVGEETYTLKFEAPEKPQISPNSDKYDYAADIIVTAQEDKNVILSARNIENVQTVAANGINVYDVMSHGTVVVTKDAVASIEEVYA